MPKVSLIRVETAQKFCDQNPDAVLKTLLADARQIADSLTSIYADVAQIEKKYIARLAQIDAAVAFLKIDVVLADEAKTLLSSTRSISAKKA